jgi:hypothetical protein
MSDEDYVVWLWQTSHASLRRSPPGTRAFAEAAVHALLAQLRTTTDIISLRQRYDGAGPSSLGLIRSVLPCGPGSVAAAPLTDADYEWLLVLEDAAFFLRYCELAGVDPARQPVAGHDH